MPRGSPRADVSVDQDSPHVISLRHRVAQHPPAGNRQTGVVGQQSPHPRLVALRRGRGKYDALVGRARRGHVEQLDVCPERGRGKGLRRKMAGQPR
eukprot:scaffold28704_cov101-Isochrysis_galbana.AAC.2